MVDEQNKTPETPGTPPEAPKSRLEQLEDTVLQLIDMVKELSDKVSTVEKTSVKKAVGLFGGKREKTAIKDKTTGTVYPSKAAVGKTLYKEIEGGDPADHFMWYKLLSKFPDRWETLSKDNPEAVKIWADEAAAKAKEVEEANKKLEAEAAAAKVKEEADAKAK
ncbi:MAG: hypothetical protein MUO97_05850, partial [Dehalococcoidia bacterium]|nr:hypothetical protein [Dehalococcoidia bacterium]